MADLITGILLAILAAGAIYGGITIPYSDGFNTSPGLFPLILGVLLLLLSAMLIYRTVKSGKVKVKINIDFKSIEVKRLAFVVASLAIYLFVLLPTIGFLPASWIFLVAFTTAFREVKFITTLITSTVSIGAIYFVFFYILKLPYIG